MIFDALFFRQFRRNGLLSLVTIAAIALAVAVLTAIQLANASAARAFAVADSRLHDRVGIQIVGSAPFDERGIARIAALPGVIAALPITEDHLLVEGREPEIVRAVGVDSLARLPIDAEFRRQRPGPFSDGGSVQSALFAGGAIVSARLAAHAGDWLWVRAGGQRVRVAIVGVFAADRAGADSSTVFFDIAAAQRLFGKRGLLDRIDLIVEPGARRALLALLAPLIPRGAEAIDAIDQRAAVQTLRDAFTHDLDALAAIALLVAALLVANAGAIGVVQRRPEIGILRALGAERGQILRAFIAEGMTFGAFGSLFGVIVGAALAGTAARALGVAADSSPDPLLLIACWTVGVVLAMLAAAYPAIVAARTPPSIAMRSTGFEGSGGGRAKVFATVGAASLLAGVTFVVLDNPTSGAFAAIAVIVGCVCLVPAIVDGSSRAFARLADRRSAAARLAAANLGLTPARIGVAVASLAIAIALAASVAIVIASFQATMLAWANATLRADIVVSTPPGTGLSPELLGRLRAVRGVAQVDAKRSASVPFRGALVRLDAQNLERTALGLRLIAGALSTDADAIVVSERFAAHFHVGLGERISLLTARGPVPLRIAAIAANYENAIGVITLDTKTDRMLFGVRDATSAAIALRSGANPIAVRTQLSRAAGALPIRLETTAELRAAIVALFNGTFVVAAGLGIVAIAIAVLGVSSTLYALVAERRMEIRLLRVLGLRARGVRSMVLYEAGMIGSLGAAIGLGLGLLLALIVLFAIDRPLFGWTIGLHVPLGTLAIIAGGVIVAALAAGLYPAHVAARLLVRDAVRAE